jgi:hypothetical protein
MKILSYLGTGSYSFVLAGSLNQGGRRLDVAIKVRLIILLIGVDVESNLRLPLYLQAWSHLPAKATPLMLQTINSRSLVNNEVKHVPD